MKMTRTESDLLGTKEIPKNCYYGIHTARALENFDLHTHPVSMDLIHAILLIKLAAAQTHRKLHMLSSEKADAIITACETLLASPLPEAFPTDALQGGAGTSTNLNVDEVVANVALKLLGHQPGEYQYLSPIDDVNRSQSTNDVYPTALRIAAIKKVRTLSDELSYFVTALQEKEQEFESVNKLGRTELMDAVPVTLGQEFGCYAQAFARDRWRIYKVEERLRQMNLGGTAVGTGDTANRKYRYLITEQLRDLTGYGLSRAEYPMDLTQNNDVFVEVSGLLKSCAVNVMKLCNDLRLMNSGPFGGLGEITLTPVQTGSSIMPGKVNPVMPEMATQVAIQIMANDTAITYAAANGQFELNAFLPLIADHLLQSLDLLERCLYLLRTRCISSIKSNPSNCEKHLNDSLVFVTEYVSQIGYEKASELYQIANGDSEQLRQLLQKELSAKKSDNPSNGSILRDKMP